MILACQNISKSFGVDPVIRNVSFHVEDQEKVAIVGINGAGKSTLLKIIVGELPADEGTVTLAKGKTLGYLAQHQDMDDARTIYETVLEGKRQLIDMEQKIRELEEGMQSVSKEDMETYMENYHKLLHEFEARDGYSYRSEVSGVLKGLGFSEDDFEKHCNELSGGQKTRVSLARLLVTHPDIILLDEPTNHLDITTIEWLETYLKNYPKAVVVVSHDRMFLDNVVDVVYEIEYGTATRYPGNYSNFMERKKENYNKMMKDYNAQQKEIARLQRIVDRFKNKPTKVSMAHSKEKAIEHMVKLEAPDRFDTRTFHANFQPDKETGNDVLLVTNLAIGYDHPLSTVSFDLKKGEKLGILGGNGLGKSTLLKTLVGQLAPLAGEYNFGTNVQIGYFDQQMAMYSSRKTVLDDFWDEFPNLTETEARNALGAFMFTGEDVFKNIDMLSGGEKVRLALCKILKRRPNVLVLDEPTNHMDIVGKETLESMLKDFSGTLIFVSHDRYFVRKVANRLLVFEDGTTHLYQFGYEEYQEKLDREAAESGDDYRKNPAALGGAISQNGAGQQSKGTQETGGKKAYYNPGKERSKIEKKVKKAEEELAVKEEKLDALKQELLRPEYQSSYSKLTEIQGEIDALEEEIMADMENWEALSQQLEELES